MMFLWLPLLFLIPFAILLMVPPAGVTASQPGMQGPPSVSGQDPLDIAAQRLARGEVSPAEYDEIRRVLLG